MIWIGSVANWWRFLLQEPGVIETEFAEIGVDRVLKHFLTYRNPAPLFLPKGNAFGDDPATPIVLPSWLSEEEVHYYTTKYQKTGFTGGLNYYRSLNRYVPYTYIQLPPHLIIVMVWNITHLVSYSQDFFIPLAYTHRTIEPEPLVWLRIVLFCNLLHELIGGLSIRHSSFIPYGRNWELTAPFTGYQSKVPTKFIVGDHDMTYHAPGSKDFIHGGGLKKYVPLLEDVIVMEGVGHFIHEEKSDEINKHIYDFFQQFWFAYQSLHPVLSKLNCVRSFETPCTTWNFYLPIKLLIFSSYAYLGITNQ